MDTRGSVSDAAFGENNLGCDAYLTRHLLCVNAKQQHGWVKLLSPMKT